MPKERTYTDIDFNLDIHPASGDVLRVYDLNAVKASVKHLVLTEFYGRPFHPEIGSSVAGLLFEPNTQLTRSAIEQTIKDVIDSYEPRATVQDVRAEFDEGSLTYRVEVDLYLYALMQAATIDVILKQVR